MTRTLQKIGNSKGLVLTKTMLDHLGVTDTVEVRMVEKEIVLTAPSALLGRRIDVDTAIDEVFDQFDETMARLADTSDL